MRRRLPIVLALAPLLGPLLAPIEAAAQDFMDTSITFVAGDDNVLAGAGETIPSSPNFDFRPRPAQNLFFDNYNQRDTGEETRTHLVLFKAFEGYFDRLTPETALILEWDANRAANDAAEFVETGSRRVPAGIRDDGSYLWLKYALNDREAFTLLLFPFDSNRFRLGYSWEITWGGNSSFILARNVPAVRFAYEATDWYVFVGLKTARTQLFTAEEDDPGRDENERVFAGLAGFGVHLSEHLLVEANGGYFQKGTIPIDRGTLEGTPIDQFGASVQVVWHDGIKPSASAETRRYRNLGDGSLRPRSWAPAAFGYQIASEFTVTSQVLEDSGALGTTDREFGYAGDVNFKLEDGQLAYAFNFVVRSLEFLVQDTPGLFPFSTVPGELDTTPEWFVAGTVAWTLPTPRLVPSITLGVQHPASARVSGVDPSTGAPFTADILVRRTKTVLGNTILEPTLLLRDEEAALLYSARLELQAHLSDLLILVADTQVTLNENILVNDASGVKRHFDPPYVLGVGLAAQARF